MLDTEQLRVFRLGGVDINPAEIKVWDSQVPWMLMILWDLGCEAGIN